MEAENIKKQDSKTSFLNETVAGAIEKRIKENGTDKRFPNRVVRNEIFGLLDQFCTVIFYPLAEEENNGFHKTYTIDGKEEQFVFINTAKQNCLQAFTAAHELGHIWNVVELVRQADYEQRLIDYTDEEIINKFAAELLMPEKVFKDAFEFQYQEIIAKGRNSGENVLKLISVFRNASSILWDVYRLLFSNLQKV